MSRVARTIRNPMRVAVLILLVALASGCSNGQVVDAGGERGQGGLAFVLLAAMFGLFLAALFYMDRVRTKRDGS